MDWIKVLTKHALYEYNDLKDSEYAAWIRIMALTAHLEHEPTRKQILQHVNYQTLDSLSHKLHDHSIDLSSILHKVLIDVSYVSHRRDALKLNTKRYRERNTAVIDDVIITSSSTSITKEKRREDNIKHIVRVLPEWIKKETWEAFLEMRKAMGAKPTERAKDLLISKLKTFRMAGQNVNKVLEQSTMNNWKGVFPLKEGGNGNGSRDFGRPREAYPNARRGQPEQGGLGLPTEYKPEDPPVISEEDRKRNLDRLKEFTA